MNQIRTVKDFPLFPAGEIMTLDDSGNYPIYRGETHNNFWLSKMFVDDDQLKPADERLVEVL